MFYSHSVLARKSPLGTVWIAAHLERKVISRTQIDGVDVPSYAASIMDPEVPIALRLSAHLLLGLVRIYSWKVNHLFQDCNRMLSAIRTAAAFAPAGADIDLPSDADRAPFAAITLPATFSLDDWNLDDAIRLIESPDNHRRAADEITLPGEEYVMVTLDEDGPSPACRSLLFKPEPHEQGTFPPFPEDAVSVDLPPQDSFHTNEHQDSPEILRRAPENVPRITDGTGSDPMDEDPSPFIEKVTTPPAMYSSLSPVRGSSLPGTSIPDVSRGASHDPMEEDEEPAVGTGILVPAAAFILEPSPPPVQGNKRRRTQNNAQENPRIDEIGVLSNDDMRSQVDGDELQRLVRRRKPLPHTALDTWKFNRRRQKDSLFAEPLVQGMGTDLQKAYERNYPRVSDSDADAANIGDGDAPPRNADTHEPEPHLTPMSPQQTEPHLTPMSPANGEATPFDHSAHELPRFSSPQMDLSTVREEVDSPFIKTPRSGLGGTSATATGSYATPGQNTRDSDPNGSQFPFGDDYLDEDLPEIPGLMNTPSVMSSADTGVTGLSSMSTRTRAAAKYYKGMMSSATSGDQRGKFSLSIILDGRTRKQAASMFFETLALKSYDYIDVHQEEAYGDISVSVRPSLSSAKL